jgi:hypothetical protein
VPWDCDLAFSGRPDIVPSPVANAMPAELPKALFELAALHETSIHTYV